MRLSIGAEHAAAASAFALTNASQICAAAVPKTTLQAEPKVKVQLTVTAEQQSWAAAPAVAGFLAQVCAHS